MLVEVRRVLMQCLLKFEDCCFRLNKMHVRRYSPRWPDENNNMAAIRF